MSSSSVMGPRPSGPVWRRSVVGRVTPPRQVTEQATGDLPWNAADPAGASARSKKARGVMKRRAVTAVAAVGVLVAAGVVVAVHRAVAEEARDAQTRKRALTADAALAETLSGMAASVAQRAHAGASLGPVERMASAGVDATTWNDFLTAEAAWAPFRAGTASAIVVGPVIMAAQGPLGDAGAIMELATTAAASGTAHALAGLSLLGAARVKSQTPTGLIPVVVLEEPLTPRLVREAMERSGAAAVTVTSGSRALTGGDEALVEKLARAEEDPCCLRRQLPGAVRVAVAVDDGDLRAATERSTTLVTTTALGLGAVLSLVLLGVGLWGPRRTEEQRRLEEAERELARSRSELKRLTQLFETGGGPTPAAPPTTVALPVVPVVHPQGSRYEVLSRLGSGGMGDVFLTVLRGPEGFTRHFVLKRLKGELQVYPEAVAQFVQEAQLGASLSHPNIAPVFDFGRDAEGYYLTQEYVPGRSVEAVLQESLRRDGRALEPSVALGIIHQVLAALAYAHGKTSSAGVVLGIVHRDVSPTNVMVGESGVVKLVDFGIVKSDQPIVTTRAGVIKGNPYFMPPEQARGQPVDHRADLFSVGMLLYHMVTGAPLYDGGEPYAALNRAALGPTVDDLTRVGRLGAPLGGIIAKAIAPELGDRFQSARAFAGAIEATGVAASVPQIEATVRGYFAAALALENARFGIGA